MLCYSAPIIGRLFFHKTVSYVLQRLSFASRGFLRDLFSKRSQWITGQEKMEDLFVRFIPNLSLIHKVVSSTLIAIYICPNKNKVNKQNNKIIELIWSCTSFCYYCNHAHSQKKQGQQNLHQIQSPHHNCYSWGPVSITSFFSPPSSPWPFDYVWSNAYLFSQMWPAPLCSQSWSSLLAPHPPPLGCCNF